MKELYNKRHGKADSTETIVISTLSQRELFPLRKRALRFNGGSVLLLSLLEWS